MNQYPAWKYILLVFVLAVSAIYAWPNLYPDDPAIQVSTHKAGETVPGHLLRKAREDLETAGITVKSIETGKSSALIRLESDAEQLRAKDVVVAAIGHADYVVALNLAPTTPGWLQSIGAWPMKLGLDLRGGVHFLLQVEMEQAVQLRMKTQLEDIEMSVAREFEREQRPLSTKLRDDGTIFMAFPSEESRDTVRRFIQSGYRDFAVLEKDGTQPALELSLTEKAIKDIQDFAIDQNRTVLSNRINELGVAEPLVQRQGADRIVVELPGIQDTAAAKGILGKTATLEFRLVDTEADARAFAGRPRLGSEVYPFRGQDRKVVVKERNIVTGNNVIDANAGFDENGQPQVSISLDGPGGARMSLVTSKNIEKPMAVLFIEQRSFPVEKKDENGNIVVEKQTREVKEIINVATIRTTLGNRFRITGLDSPAEANELALLLRSGALAANMYFVEERTIGPSLGKENIKAGFESVVVGFVLVLGFMLMYYKAFGMIANVALMANLVIIVAVMSALQATLTLPGIAGIVLTVGMAVDANVLIFARIKEELAKGLSSQEAISEGYDRAFETILDANITTFLVALVLFAAGSGTVKGFAITLCIGIVTSMFTSIMGTRALVNLFYGNRKVRSLSI